MSLSGLNILFSTFKVQNTLLPEEDFVTAIRTDDGYTRRAETACDPSKEVERAFTKEAQQSPLQVRRKIAARNPPPVVPPPTPSVQSAPVAVPVANGSQAQSAAAAAGINNNPAILAPEHGTSRSRRTKCRLVP